LMQRMKNNNNKKGRGKQRVETRELKEEKKKMKMMKKQPKCSLLLYRILSDIGDTCTFVVGLTG